MAGLSSVSFLWSCTASARVSRLVGGRRRAALLLSKYSSRAWSSFRAMAFSKPVKFARQASQCPTSACSVA